MALVIKKKIGELTLIEFQEMCSKYERCKGCPIENEMMACPMMSEKELNFEIEFKQT